MRVTLERCGHFKVTTYRTDGTEVHGICESCFARVRAVRPRVTPKDVWVADPPVGGGKCTHPKKHELVSKLTMNKPYRNAVCMACGWGLRAPNNVDEWKPLREYRFIVKEWA